MPFDGIPIVGREFMMEVVIPFPQRHQSRDDVIARRIPVIKRLIAKPMGQRVDAKGRLLHEENPKDAAIHKATPPIPEESTACHGGENQTHEDDHLEVMAMLPDDDGVFIQIGNIGTADSLGILLHNHPAEMGVQQALADRVWVLVGIGVTVMGAMISGPPAD